MMKTYKYVLFILMSACSLLPIPAGASGLGEISVISPLGDRFRAEIPLLNPSSSITTACFGLTKDSPDAIDGIPWLTNAQIVVLSSPPRLVISTRRQVVDPVIQLAIHSSCDAPLTRHYTALLSPPAGNTELPVADRLPGDILPHSVRARPDIAAREKPQAAQTKPGRTARVGETAGDMARRMFPRNRRAQQRFIRQMVALNPEWLSSESGDEILPEDVELHYPAPSVPQATAARQATQAKPAKRKTETPAGVRDRLVLMPFDPPPEPPAALAAPGEINKQLSEVDLQINTLRTELNRLRAENTAPSPAIQTALLEMESRLLVVELNAARITLKNLQAERPANVAAPAPEVPADAANSEKPAVLQPPPPAAPPAPIVVAPVPGAATFLTANTVLLVLLGLFAVGLSAILYRRRARSRKESLSGSTQASPAADAEPLKNPVPAKVTVSSPTPTQAEPRKEIETPVASSVVETPEASSVAENPMELEYAIELADIFLTYGRTQDALDVLHTFIQDNPKETLRPSLMLLDIYKQADMRPEFENLAEQLAKGFKVKLVQWDDTRSPAIVNPGKSAAPG